MNVPAERQASLAAFMAKTFQFYCDLYYSYFEVNPLVVLPDGKSVVGFTRFVCVLFLLLFVSRVLLQPLLLLL
jgi:hypothetical protein